MKLTGDACPKLYNKWQPLEFEDFNLDENGVRYSESKKGEINQSYIFNFAFLDINFDYKYFTRQEIAAQQIMPETEYPEISKIFNKEILELYLDTKKFVQKQINEVSKSIPELQNLVVDKYSKFQRAIKFEYTVDIPFKNVEIRNKTAIEMYLSLKEQLIETFSKKEETTNQGNFMGFPIGSEEHLKLSNGIELCTSGNSDYVNAGTIYLSILCDENGSQNEFQKVFKETEQFMMTNYKNKLIKYSNNSCFNFGLKGTGSYWQILLPEIKLWKQIPNENKHTISFLTQKIQN